MIKSKKAAVEVQFNWIFVIIVGSLILLFFVSVVNSTRKSSEQGLAVDIQKDLENIIEQSQVDVGTTRTIGIPDMDFLFECTEMSETKASAGGVKIPYNPIFSPDLLGGREIIAYSLYYNMPYPVTQVLYLTSKQIRYNFVNSTGIDSCWDNPSCQSFFKTIIKNLPANLTYQIVSKANKVEDDNYYKERFIYFNIDPDNDWCVAGKVFCNDLSKKKDSEVTAINIQSSNENYGEVKFYIKDDDGFKYQSSSVYLGFPMLLGAIFSEENLYNCNVKKIMTRFKIMTTIYNDRVNYLEDFYNATNIVRGSYEYDCFYIYERLDLSNTLTLLDNDYDIGVYNQMHDLTTDIGLANKATIEYSCPLIY